LDASERPEEHEDDGLAIAFRAVIFSGEQFGDRFLEIGFDILEANGKILP
jgi:hypothetical protein